MSVKSAVHDRLGKLRTSHASRSPIPARPASTAWILKNRPILVRNDPFPSQREPSILKSEVRVPAQQDCRARAPRLLCPCTKAAVPVHQDCCARTPRLLCPCTKTAVPMHQDCCARSARLLRPFSKTAMPVQQDCYARAPRLIYPCTQLGTHPNLPDSWAHQACHPGLSARFPGTSSLSPALNRKFPGHSAPFAAFFVD